MWFLPRLLGMVGAVLIPTILLREPLHLGGSLSLLGRAALVLLNLSLFLTTGHKRLVALVPRVLRQVVRRE